jgi:site-specific DNA-adenine methylase
MSKKIDTLPLGCMGNKQNELKLLLPIIQPQITDKTIFIEPFVGSCIVSFNVYKQINKNIEFHINDIDSLRIQFYINMMDEEKRNELYKLEESILKNGMEEYNKIIKKNNPQAMRNEYIPYVITRRIHGFRFGLYPTTKKIILKQISENWINFFHKAKITNNDFIEVMEEYKENENAFLYIDPPYMDSFNGGYNCYHTKNYNNDLTIKDNTYMYIYLLEFLKVCKCKILFSINSNSLTRYLYKDYIKENYKHVYQSSHINIEGLSLDEKGNKIRKKNTNVLIISNF